MFFLKEVDPTSNILRLSDKVLANTNTEEGCSLCVVLGLTDIVTEGSVFCNFVCPSSSSLNWLYPALTTDNLSVLVLHLRTDKLFCTHLGI